MADESEVTALLDELEVVRNWLHQLPPAVVDVCERASGRRLPTHELSSAIDRVWLLHGKPARPGTIKASR